MLAARIALRYLFSRKSHAAVNIISYVSIAGVAIAAAAIVIVLSVFNGFHDFAAAKLSQLDPDMVVAPNEGKAIEHADSLAALIAQLPAVDAAAPVVEEHAFAIAGERQMPIVLRGVDVNGPTAEALQQPHLIIDGSGSLESGEYMYNKALSSVGVANSLRAIPSYPEIVRLYEPRRRGRINPANPMAAFRVDSVIVSGVYRVEQAEYDTDMMIVSLDVARNLLDYTDQATRIEMRLVPGVSESSAREQLAQVLPQGLVVKNRYEQQEEAFRMIAVEKWVTLLMLTFILVIASFNILSTMSMLIVEKQGNRAIMIAMGATPANVSSVFSWLSFMISSIGGVIGIVVGAGLSLAQQYGKFIKLSVSDMSSMALDVYPVRVSMTDMLIVIAVTAFIGSVTALIINRFTRR